MLTALWIVVIIEEVDGKLQCVLIHFFGQGTDIFAYSPIMLFIGDDVNAINVIRVVITSFGGMFLIAAGLGKGLDAGLGSGRCGTAGH